ncbi:MAG: MATE family efflux transporter [Oscillospiraceae bacterium]
MKQNIYEQKSLTKLIFIFGIPSILSLMIEMLTGVVDTVFAGNLPNIGESALAAMAIISPILGIFTALQTLFAMSTGILIAKYLNHEQKQKTRYTTGVVMSAIMALITSFVCYFSLSAILTALKADGQIFILAKQYLQIQLISNIASSIGYTLTCCIRAFGYPKTEVKIITCAVGVNIVFNFIFAFVFNLGIAGLALGTLVSESVCAISAILFLIKKKLWISNERIPIRSFMHSAFELFKIGIAQTAIQVLGGCTGFVLNARLLSLGSMMHVAAYSVVQRIYTFVLMPIVGLTQGVQNIISYFSGNDDNVKIKKVSKITMLLCSGYGFIALLAVLLFGQNLASLFGGNFEITAIAKTVLLIVFMGFPLIGILYTDMTLLQVTQHELASVLLILSRQVFFLIPLVYLIPYLITLTGINVEAVMSLFFCMPVADLLSVIFASIVKKAISRKENCH